MWWPHSAALVPPQPDGAGAEHCRIGADLFRRVLGAGVAEPAHAGGRAAGPGGARGFTRRAHARGGRPPPPPAPGGARPLPERAIVPTPLFTLYARTRGSAKAELINRQSVTMVETVYPVMVVLGVSIIVAAVLALVLRMALRFMSPTSENTSMLFLALVAAGTAVAAHMGGSAPLAALLGGMLLKQLNPRPWAWPRQLGNASSLLTMLMFVLVSTVAAQADWSAPVAGVVLALIAVRLVAKATGVALGNVGSGASWKQALWVGCAMTPMSSIALLIASQFVLASPSTGHVIAGVALPAILLMEVLGAVIATVAIYRAGESSKPWAPLTRSNNGENSRES